MNTANSFDVAASQGLGHAKFPSASDMDSSLHCMKAFVFTDIVASTRLKNALPGKTQADRDREFIDMILEPHRTSLESNLQEHKGRLVKTLGDGCFLVFDSPMRAALWAMDVQSQHNDNPIVLPNDERVGVKIGIHHGEATLDPHNPNDFSGRNVDYAARLVELATDGRIIVSRSMYAQLEDAGIYGVEFHEHGERELRGIGSKTVYELLWDELKPKPLKGDVPEEDKPASGGSSPSANESPTKSPSDVITKAQTGSSIGNYVLGRRLGSGAMGTVYEAEHPGMAQTFAIKVIDDSLLSESEQHMVGRFYREIKAISRLNHPNIVRAHNASLRSDPIHYLVMEYLDGLSLDRVMVTRPVNWSIATEVVRRATLGLDYIHQNELVHRDIKPSNILVTYPKDGQESEIKILDLGLALLLDEDERETRFQNSIMGSAYYMSPEQWQSSEVDIRADIYSLGCTFYHLLTGRAPFQDSAYNQKYAHQNLPVPKFPEQLEIPPKLWSIMEQMLAKSPSDRYTTPSFLLEELDEVGPSISLSTWAHSFSEEATKSYELTKEHGDTVDEPSSPSKEKEKVSPIRKVQARLSDVISAHPRTTMLSMITVMAVALSLFVLVAAQGQGAAKGEVSADELATVNNLNGAPAAIGDWWFDQAPWFTPAIRAELAKEFESGGSDSKAHESLERIQDYYAKGDTENLIAELKSFRDRALRNGKIGKAEYDVAYNLESLSNRQGEDLIDNLLHLRESLSKSTQAHELHLRAAVNHKLGLSLKNFLTTSRDSEATLESLRRFLVRNGRKEELLEAPEYLAQAEADYQSALDTYEADERLRVLLLTDFARLMRYVRPAAGLELVNQAVHQSVIEDAALSRATILALQAYLLRKRNEATIAIEKLIEAQTLLDSKDGNQEIPENHPFRIAIDERLGWANFETWNLRDAENHFARYIERLTESDSRDNGESQRRNVQLFRAHARMGQAMVMHYSGRQEEAIALYDELLDEFGSKKSQSYKRRSLNFLDRKADALLFGPNPQPEEAVNLFKKYEIMERDVTVPAMPEHLKNLRMCIALAQAGEVEMAKAKLESLDQSLSSSDPMAKIAFLIANLYSNDDADISELLEEVREIVFKYDESELRKPHPHLSQLLLLACEEIATRCAAEQDVEKLNRTASALLNLYDQLQGNNGRPNQLFRRYLDSTQSALTMALESENNAEMRDHLNDINRLLR